MSEDVVNHPGHYQPRFASRPIECIDVTRHMGFCDGNAFKYVWRAGKKGDPGKRVEDLKKARWYLTDCTGGALGSRDVDRRSPEALAIFNQLEMPVLADRVERTVFGTLLLIVSGEYDGAVEKVEELLRDAERGEAAK